METNKIYQGECIEIMKRIEDNSIDLVIVDPPYNISKENDNRDRSKLNSPIMRRESPLKYDFGEWDNKTREEFLEFTKTWLKECCRVLKENGTIISFFNKEDISYLGWTAKDYGIRTRTILSWHKTNPVPSFRKVNYLSACEFLWIGSKGKWTFNFKQQKEMHNFFETANKSSYGETSHPTEKPLSLIRHLIEVHSNKDELVLDCFLGCGTTAIACKQLGRNFIGIESIKEYVDMANKRLEQTCLWKSTTEDRKLYTNKVGGVLMEIVYLTQPPKRYTFEQPKLREWVEQQCKGKVLNLFAGRTKLNVDEYRVDFDKDVPADHYGDAFDFVSKTEMRFDTIILDPPWSIRKSREKYGGRVVGSFTKIKDVLRRILNDNGRVITVGYSSTGMSKSRGFQKIALAVVCHNGDHDDSFAIVEEDYEKDTEVVVEEKVDVTKYSIKGLSKDHPAQRDFNNFMQKHKGVKSGCDANDDGIPPNNKLSGILPTIL